MAIKLKKNETFYIREGWFEKAINCIHENEGKNIFFKNEGVEYLGIGSNMVKSMKYWLKTAEIIEDKDNHLTEFGRLLYQYDPYLDHKFSWFLIHYFLIRNENENPIAYTIFNYAKEKSHKDGLRALLMEHFMQIDKNVKEKLVEDDLNVFLNSYICSTIIDNPEDNYFCPLSGLKLMRKTNNTYIKTVPAYKSLSYLVIYYNLYQLEGGKPFVIDDSIDKINSPTHLFNLDQYSYMQYLDEMRKNDLITINKTAGLNTVYFDKALSLQDIFEENFQ